MKITVRVSRMSGSLTYLYNVENNTTVPAITDSISEKFRVPVELIEITSVKGKMKGNILTPGQELLASFTGKVDGKRLYEWEIGREMTIAQFKEKLHSPWEQDSVLIFKVGENQKEIEDPDPEKKIKNYFLKGKELRVEGISKFGKFSGLKRTRIFVYELGFMGFSSSKSEHSVIEVQREVITPKN